MAGLLLHLTSFTHWPVLESDDFQLCILGNDPFKSYLDSMVKRRPKNRSGQVIVIRRLDQSSLQPLSNCQLIFVAPSHYEALWQQIPPSHPILLVSQSDNFISQGGMINFAMDKKKVRLEVNLPAVQAANLKISSELLKHAKVIEGTPHQQFKTERGVNVSK
ncbi:YfiR family protein [Thalassotalea atypica]|uniref:YfiR family protein n=1 Tax=Thalassotalea atypica TaxID=2054316 RepID=UPI002573521E|nr:YfiR family protein [Thalassotalea atypica]